MRWFKKKPNPPKPPETPLQRLLRETLEFPTTSSIFWLKDPNKKETDMATTECDTLNEFLQQMPAFKALKSDVDRCAASQYDKRICDLEAEVFKYRPNPTIVNLGNLVDREKIASLEKRVAELNQWFADARKGKELHAESHEKINARVTEHDHDIQRLKSDVGMHLRTYHVGMDDLVRAGFPIESPKLVFVRNADVVVQIERETREKIATFVNKYLLNDILRIESRTKMIDRIRRGEY